MGLFSIILFPLVGFLINAFFGKRLGEKMSGIVGTLAVAGAFVCALSAFMSGLPQKVHLFNWFSTETINLGFDLYIDQLSGIMTLVITGVGALIHLYSTAYMHDDERFPTYFAYLNLFIVFMLLLVLGGNFLMMFIGWEGVGLCSYLLIGYWFKKSEYNAAANKAFIMNRIGDLGLLIGIFLIATHFNSLDFDVVNTKAAAMTKGSSILTIITLCLFVGATGKSAQLPLFTWLPDAMAGPTPVSALIHAATMVTAGIYMVFRCNGLFDGAPLTQEIVLIIGLATAIFAATIGLKQNDIKKVLAYSTVSQLGYMFFALGLGAYTAAFFHVFTHAFFKALLFLGSGSVIHGLHGEQDIRKMGDLKGKMPITYWTFLIGTIAIAGIPPFAGFFSKDQILAAAFAHNPILWILGVGGALLTAFYMFRLFFLVFHGEYRGDKHTFDHAHESPLAMTIPLMVLAAFSALAGFLNVPHVLGGHAGLDKFLSPVLVNGLHEHAIEHGTEMMLMGGSVLLVLCAIGFAYSRYISKKHVPSLDDASLSGIENLLNKKYFVDEIYNSLIVKPLDWVSSKILYPVDKSGVDGIVNGIGQATVGGGQMLRQTQAGGTGFYIFAMVIGMILLFLLKLVF